MLLALAATEGAVRLCSPRGFARALPAAPAGRHFTPQQIRRGKRYARVQGVLGTAHGAIELALLLALVRRARRRSASTVPAQDASPEPPPERGSVREVARGAAAGAGLALAGTLASLPVVALARAHGRSYGLVTQSWGGWLGDLLRAGAIQTGFAALAGGGAVALIRRRPRDWWAPAAAISWSFGAGLAALAPVVLDPIFNDFAPLDDAALRQRVLALAAAAGVRVGEVLRVDASRRTSAANAYVAGLGPTRRVVLFDTLLERYTPEEVGVVVAHELAHVRHGDVRRALAFAALTAAPAARAVQQTGDALAPRATGSAAALPALALSAALVSAPLSALGSRLSRAVVRRADSFALDLAGAPAAFVSFQRRIAVQNLADVRAPRWRALLASHPPVLERIAMAQTAD
jgi:STE24 endopeptidase